MHVNQKVMRRNIEEFSECEVCGQPLDEDGNCDQCGYRDDGEGWMNWVPKQ